MNLEKAYRAFKERQTQRRKALAYSVALFIIYILLAVYMNFNATWFLEYWYWVGVLGFVVGLPYVMTRPWAHEMVETEIFVYMYDASKLLELCSEKDENSTFYSRKAISKVNSAIVTLGGLQYSLEKILSKLFKREFSEPLKQLKENLSTRILPRIAQLEDTEIMIRVLRGLAKLFGEVEKPISLDDIIAKNKDLECYEPMEFKETIRFHDRLLTFLSSHKILRHGIFVFTLIIACCVFYYMVVCYLGISKEYALTASVAIFLSFLATYFTKRSR